MLPSHTRDGHRRSVYGNTAFCSAAGHEAARKTQKPGISVLSMTFTKGQINTEAVELIRGSVQKRFPIELSQQGTAPRSTPFFFSV